MTRISERIRTGALALALALGSSGEADAQIMLASSGAEQRLAGPGEAYGGFVRVRNTGSEPQEARLYLTDYESQADGSTRFPEPGSTARSNAGWILVSPSHLTIPPGREVAVRYRVRVPENAALSGSYWSMLMIEGIARSSAEAAGSPPRHGEGEIGVRATVRYAVQLVTHIGTTGEPKIELAGTRVEAGPSGRQLVLDVRNTGSRASAPVVRVEILDAAGTKVQAFERKRGLLLPGGSVRQPVELAPLPPGTYEAQVTIDAGGDDVFRARYTLRL